MTDDETAFEPLDGTDALRLLRAFAQHEVRSIVIGGYAVRLHGYWRPPGDLDLVVDPASDSLEHMERALTDLGVGEASAVRDLFSRTKQAKWDWREGYLDHDVDLLSAATPFTYADLAASTIAVEHDGLHLSVMSKTHLIAAKKAALIDPARHDSKKAQDREDLQQILQCEQGRPTIG